MAVVSSKGTLAASRCCAGTSPPLGLAVGALLLSFGLLCPISSSRALTLAPRKPKAQKRKAGSASSSVSKKMAFTLLSGKAGKGKKELQNVNGGPLAKCSHDGEAMTGFTRTGQCVDAGNDDQGSHHICIKMPKEDNFCTVTGQPNWCAEPGECQGQEGECAINHWCVCQWAYEHFIEAKGGCGELDCEATNMVALTAYQEGGHEQALTCLKQECGIA